MCRRKRPSATLSEASGAGLQPFPFWENPDRSSLSEGTARCSSWPGLSRPSASFGGLAVKAWMAGTRPAMTVMSGVRKVHIKSFGCQMNVYDSHRMADTLAPEGFAETASPEDADLVILNTCHIREKAVEKVYSEIGRIREMKEAAARDGRSMTIAVAGCVAQAEGKEIIRRASAVDLVVGSQNYHRLPEMIARARRGDKVVDTEFPIEDKFEALAEP